jgi:hypothetical protein
VNFAGHNPNRDIAASAARLNVLPEHVVPDLVGWGFLFVGWGFLFHISKYKQ